MSWTDRIYDEDRREAEEIEQNRIKTKEIEAAIKAAIKAEPYDAEAEIRKLATKTWSDWNPKSNNPYKRDSMTFQAKSLDKLDRGRLLYWGIYTLRYGKLWTSNDGLALNAYRTEYVYDVIAMGVFGSEKPEGRFGLHYWMTIADKETPTVPKDQESFFDLLAQTYRLGPMRQGTTLSYRLPNRPMSPGRPSSPGGLWRHIKPGQHDGGM